MTVTAQRGMKMRLLAVAASLLFGLTTAAHAAPDLRLQLADCVAKDRPLERLNCFDEVASTHDIKKRDADEGVAEENSARGGAGLAPERAPRAPERPPEQERSREQEPRRSDPGAAQSDTSSEIAARCRSKWSGDYRMQEYCQKQQNEGLVWVSTWMSRNNVSANPEGTAARLLAKCGAKWEDPRFSYDWTMVAYCVEQQEKARGRLR
jgi:hypothetical protein